ncbi:MAG: hypothetical protein RQ899_14540 [Pseudomonadales bacterium]|nr:hypothetical protein [Pseudomonadales bacterium]
MPTENTLPPDIQVLISTYRLNCSGNDLAQSALLPALDAFCQTPLSAAQKRDLQQALAKLQHWQTARSELGSHDRAAMAGCIRQLVSDGHAHVMVRERFRDPANLVFLEKGLMNAACLWQMLLVAHWALSPEGLRRFECAQWRQRYPGTDLHELLAEIKQCLHFPAFDSLKAYRRQVLHNYPKLSREEFDKLSSQDWHQVIDQPSGRAAEQDIPALTPFVKQGNIEHSLLRHYLLPHLYDYLRARVPSDSRHYDLKGKDRDIALGLAVAVNQISQEVAQHLRQVIAALVKTWADALQGMPDSEAAAALGIAQRIWEYQRAGTAHDCKTPVENIAKGFNASIMNALGHCTDTLVAAQAGEHLALDAVTEKFNFYASVSNGQLDNLAAASAAYAKATPHPCQRNAQGLLQHFIASANASNLNHIHAHFLIDKTRGCPAIPQIDRFHTLIIDLLLHFLLQQFGVDNLRKAGQLASRGTP